MANEQNSSEDLYAQVRRLVAEEYCVDVDVVKLDTYLDDDLGGIGNCIDIWEFIWSLEVRYNIEIPIAEVGTVRDVSDYIRKHRIRKQT